jgi:hypothetical protein
MNHEPAPYDPIPWARYAGQQAREHGREIKTCPMYALGEEGRLLRKAWEDGWNKGGQRK